MPPNTSSPPLIGWPLLPTPDADGRLRFPTLETSIRQNIEVILRTRPGEQLMRPEYGAGLEDFVHEPNTLATRAEIRDRVAEALARWEPRIALDRIDVIEAAVPPGGVRVEIAYRVRRTGASLRLGLNLFPE